ncbi:hypothetical protein GQ53DRAFT_452395 [Thozetella sp. PMI_491]|nr:hypothetical protein GQ53DRAFT_452395 [Thozetella sp. PMI_491]
MLTVWDRPRGADRHGRLAGANALHVGYLYCRKNAAGSCLGDLGDFPGKKSFPLYVSIDAAEVAKSAVLLAEHTGSSTYNRYRDVLYVDIAPGAVKPVGFADPSVLTASQRSNYFFFPYGIVLYSPTSDAVDATPIANPGRVTGTGFQLIEVPGHPGVFQQYWNQTLFDSMRNGTSSGGAFAAYCHGDYSPVITDLDHP